MSVARRPAIGAPRPSATLTGVTRTGSPATIACRSASDPVGLHAVHAHRGRLSLRATVTPPSSPPPPTAITTTSTSGRSSRISRPHEPLPSRTSGSSYGCTSVRPRSSRMRCRCSQRLADVRAVEHDLRAVLETGRHLGRDGALGHHDRHRHAGLAPRPRVGLARVPGADRDRAAAALVGVQRRDAGEGGPWLERPRLLEVLGLEVEAPVPESLPDHGSRDPGRRHRREHRRVVDSPGERSPASRGYRPG